MPTERASLDMSPVSVTSFGLFGPAYDGDTLGAGGDALGQTNVPTALALVHAHDDSGGTGRVVGRIIEQKEARAQLCDRDGIAVKDQADPHVGGVTDMAAGLKIHE